MCKKFYNKLLIGLLSLGMGNMAINATSDEAYEPLQSPSRTATQPATTHPTCVDRCINCLPAWYHPCFGPIVTNIKYLDCDPYWVDQRGALFQEIYRELEPFGRCVPRLIHKLWIVSRNHDGREDRYDPLLNWCANLGWIACLTMVPIGLDMGAESITGGVLIGTSGTWCIAGCCTTAAWYALVKIHYDPPRPGILGYLRSPMPTTMT